MPVSGTNVAISQGHMDLTRPDIEAFLAIIRINGLSNRHRFDDWVRTG
jgi:hypothetical protein